MLLSKLPPLSGWCLMWWGLGMDGHLTRQGINNVRGHEADEPSLQWSLLYVSENVKRKKKKMQLGSWAALADGCEWLGSSNSSLAPEQSMSQAGFFFYSYGNISTSNDNYYHWSGINCFQNQTKEDLPQIDKGQSGKSMNMAAKSGHSLTSMDMCVSKPGCGSASADLIPPGLALQGIVNIC